MVDLQTTFAGIELRNVWERLPATAELSDETRRFLGFWEIDRIERRTLDGTELSTEQFAAGYLVYMPSGYMAVHLMRPDRRPYEGPRPTALEAHAAMGSYASYFGRFSVDAEEGVVVHHRDAEDDFLRIADEEDLAACGAILHCFTASERLARAGWERGFLISFSGILTFKNAEDLRRTAALVPLDHLLVETDSPYLAPVPHRGKRAEPAMVVETARALADVRSVDLEEIEAATDANFRRFFFGSTAGRRQGSATKPALPA